MTDDDADSPRSAVSISEARQHAVAAAAANDPVSRPVAHHIHFWEHISPVKGGDGLSRAHSAPVAIRQMQVAPGRQSCHVHYEVHLQVNPAVPLLSMGVRCAAATTVGAARTAAVLLLTTLHDCGDCG